MHTNTHTQAQDVALRHCLALHPVPSLSFLELLARRNKEVSLPAALAQELAGAAAAAAAVSRS